MLDSHRVGGSDDEVNTGTPSTRIVARRAGRRAIIAPDVRQGFAGAVRVSGGSRCPNGASACRGAAWTVRLHCLLRLCDLRMADVSDCGAWSPSPPEIVAADVVSRSTTAEPCIVLLRYYSASGTSTCSASHQRSAARTPSTGYTRTVAVTVVGISGYSLSNLGRSSSPSWGFARNDIVAYVMDGFPAEPIATPAVSWCRAIYPSAPAWSLRTSRCCIRWRWW